jgi:hypothetical protein
MSEHCVQFRPPEHPSYFLPPPPSKQTKAEQPKQIAALSWATSSGRMLYRGTKRKTEAKKSQKKKKEKKTLRFVCMYRKIPQITSFGGRSMRVGPVLCYQPLPASAPTADTQGLVRLLRHLLGSCHPNLDSSSAVSTPVRLSVHQSNPLSISILHPNLPHDPRYLVVFSPPSNTQKGPSQFSPFFHPATPFFREMS